jgi:hypothetical protein
MMSNNIVCHRSNSFPRERTVINNHITHCHFIFYFLFFPIVKEDGTRCPLEGLKQMQVMTMSNIVACYRSSFEEKTSNDE